MLEVVVGHPPLDVEVGLDIGLPGLAALDLLLLDPERGVDRHGALRLEDAAAVAHDRLGCAVLGDRREQDLQVGGLILGPGEGAADDEAAVVVEDRDAVDVAAAELMDVDVADVDRPVLVATMRP